MPKLTYTTPPPSLMIELREVATDAHALATELANANQLPSEFPAEPLQELLAELQALPDGTAEGCRQPLEHVRLRLPAIRRTFIQTEDQSRQLRKDTDARPPLIRGMVIDQRIGALVNSVTTALDEYRTLASVEFEDTADTAPSLKIDTNSAEAVEASAVAIGTEKNLGGGIDEVTRIAKPTSARADNLKRQMRDTRTLFRLARIELRMPEFVPRWYRKTIDAIGDYPHILQKTAGAMQIGVDVARPLADAWSHFSHGYKRLILDSIEHAAKGLEAVAAKWEEDRVTKPKPAAIESNNYPNDFDLDVVHKIILTGTKPQPSWQPWIKRLNFFGTNLQNLWPLADLASLQRLILDGTRVNDLTPLANLVALRTLDLDSTRVTDLTPLAGLTALQTLDLNSTQISNLAPLAGLTSLQTLWLGRTRVSDLAPLAGLTALQTLYLNDTPVSDLTPLAGLATLQTLYLNDTSVSDLAPLEGLETLAEVLVESSRRRNTLARTLKARGNIVRVSE